MPGWCCLWRLVRPAVPMNRSDLWKVGGVAKSTATGRCTRNSGLLRDMRGSNPELGSRLAVAARFGLSEPAVVSVVPGSCRVALRGFGDVSVSAGCRMAVVPRIPKCRGICGLVRGKSSSRPADALSSVGSCKSVLQTFAIAPISPICRRIIVVRDSRPGASRLHSACTFGILYRQLPEVRPRPPPVI